MFQLMRNLEGIEKVAGGIDVIRVARKNQGSNNGAAHHSWEKQCQRSVYMCLHSLTLEPPWQRVREKLQRWLLQNASKHLEIPGTARQNTPEWQSRHKTHRSGSLGGYGGYCAR